MKPHRKTKRQPRKKVMNAATKTKHIRVNNTYKDCIPQQLENKPADYGTWKIPTWNAELRKKRLEDLGPRKRVRGHRAIKRKAPWFMLTKGKQFKYMSVDKEWGTYIYYVPVDSEIKTLNKHYIIPKLGEAERFHKIEELKMAKWERKNPRPIKEGSNDLFEKHFLPEWKAAREKELERIRDFIVLAYGKPPEKTKHTKKKEYSHKHLAKIIMKPGSEVKQEEMKLAA